CASPTVTAVFAPEGIGADEIRKILRTEYGVIFAGGQGALKGKIFRIAHMGFAGMADVIVAAGALEMALARMGLKIELGAGVRKAQEVFLGRA
ncbi:MAG: alanine--glyoxylate aminotransferase family protein, partial [Desulfotomaculales bacterium]